MRAGFAWRFAVEALFLVLLAVGAGFSDLETRWIAAVMAAGWVIVTGVEWLGWRAERRIEAAVAPRALPVAEEQHGWDVAEILAPLPEEPQGEARTGILPPEGAPSPER
jgi:hypothetical protein